MVDRGSFSDISHLSFVDDRVRSYAPVNANTSLPVDWEPSPWSVICGRGKDSYDHVGNRRFRILIDLNLQKYKDSKSKIGKSLIVMSIIDAVREGSVMGGFVKKDPSSKRWNEVPDSIAREKVGQQIRETMAKMNPMKCEARKIQRKTKTKRVRLAATQSASKMLMSFSSSASSSAVSFSSAGEEMTCSVTSNWGNNDAIDTDDTTPLQVDYTALNSNPPKKKFDFHFASTTPTFAAIKIRQPHSLRQKR